ncbi:MAG: type II secretion system secretin GspD [Nitrospirota bacterium]
MKTLLRNILSSSKNPPFPPLLKGGEGGFFSLSFVSLCEMIVSLVLCLSILFPSESIAETIVTGEKVESPPIENIQTGEKKVSFNFVGVDIPTVVKFISDVTGKNFIFDDRIKGTITIIAPSRLSVDEAFSLFTSVLELKGFTIVPSGKIFKIVPASQAKQSSTEIVKDIKPPVSDTYITRLIQLKSVSSSNAVNFLQPIISKDGYIASFGPSNMLMIVDSVTNIEKIIEILDTIDKPGVEEPEIILLKHANAEDVAKIINEALGIGGKIQTSPSVARTPGGQTVSIAEKGTIVFADTRLNALVLFTDKQEREAIKRIVALLDIPLPEATSKINVCFLEYADATELSKVLENMIKGISTQSAAGGTQPQKTPFEMGGKIGITSDKATNSIIIVASPADYQNLLQVIKQLDKRRKQVYVEAMIVEASIENLMELGSEWRLMGEEDGEPVAIGGFGTMDSSSLQDVIYGLSGVTVGGMGNFLDVPLTTVDSEGTATTSTLTIPGLSALFSLVEFKGAVNVLSTPQILTSDNQEAEIVVGENVPFISKREVDATTDETVLSSIERKDVGITLRITPQITEGDYVKLDIYQEISSVKDASETILINVGPSTTKRSTETSVVVKDNQTVVIGGLMEEKEQETITKVPLLGDIPLLGWLFKYKSVEKVKTNLLVFLTPHIIKDAVQLSRLTEDKKIEFARREKRHEEGELLVKFEDEVTEERINEILSAEGASIKADLQPKGLYLIKLKEGQSVKEAIKVFNKYEEVEYAEPNYIMKIK